MAETAKPPAKEPTPAELRRKQAMQVGILVLTFCVLGNAAFYFLSELYYDDRARRFGGLVWENLPGVRRAFAVFTISIGLASVVAALAPRVVGYGIAGVASIASFVAAWGAWTNDLPGVLAVSLVLLALVFPLLIWRSLVGSRGAWAFLIALSGVYGLILLFGAPKVRNLMGIGLWHALIIPGLLAVGTIALVMLRSDYRER